MGLAVVTQYTRKKWSDEEEQFLINNASAMTISDVASALNRSYNSVRLRAALLGVKPIPSDKNNKLTREEIAFITDHSDTMTASEMSAALSRPTQTIENIAERHGVTIEKRARHKWTDEELAELKELVETGFHYEDIARHFGVTQASITIAARKQGLSNGLTSTKRSHVAWNADEVRVLTRMYEGGDAVTDICEKLGRSEQSVRRKARCLGLLRPDLN